MHTTPILATSFALLSTALAAPLISRSETWPIPNFDVHFMGRDTGLPGNEWPYKFNSTLDFTVTFPTGPVACSANWEETHVPTEPISCATEGHGVAFQLGPRADGVFTEIAYTLTVSRTTIDETSGNITTLEGSQEIRANSPGQANSYLSCLGGAPLTGINCHTTGWASTSSPLVLVADVVEGGY